MYLLTLFLSSYCLLRLLWHSSPNPQLHTLFQILLLIKLYHIIFCNRVHLLLFYLYPYFLSSLSHNLTHRKNQPVYKTTFSYDKNTFGKSSSIKNLYLEALAPFPLPLQLIYTPSHLLRLPLH